MTTTNTTTRTVRLHLDADTQTTMQLSTGIRAWYEAIGYLSTWNTSYPSVDIYSEPGTDTDLVAMYKDEDGKAQYSIGAVWNGTAYGFHS